VELHHFGGKASPALGPCGRVWIMIGSSKDHSMPVDSDCGIAAHHRRFSSGRWNSPLAGQLQVWG